MRARNRALFYEAACSAVRIKRPDSSGYAPAQSTPTRADAQCDERLVHAPIFLRKTAAVRRSSRGKAGNRAEENESAGAGAQQTPQNAEVQTRGVMREGSVRSAI